MLATGAKDLRQESGCGGDAARGAGAPSLQVGA